MDDVSRPTTATLPGSGRRLRSSRSDAPWPGEFVGEADGTSTLHVRLSDAAQEGWDADPAGHILAPMDVAHGPDGLEAVYPLCRLRLPTLLRARADAGAPLAPGEGVTAAVSVLRGAAACAGDAPGEWWITDDARPVLVLGEGPASVDDASREVLRLLAAQLPADAESLLAAAEAIGDAAACDAAEHALFAGAEPAPVQLETLAARPARSFDAILAADSPPERGSARSAVRELVQRHLDTGIAGAVADALQRAREGWTRWRARPADAPAGAAPEASPAAPAGRERRSRGVLVTAGVAATVVLGAGILWPDAEEVGTAAAPSIPSAPPSTAASVPATTAPTPDAPPDAETVGADDPTQIAITLLAAAAACSGGGDCTDVAEDPTRLPLSGAAALPEAERTVTLVDDYGGVLAVRVTSARAETPDAIVVLVESAGKWLIRDAYDVADQP